MLTAKEIMEAPFSVEPELPVLSLAKQLLEKRLDGACVVEDGKLLGVVTSMDLIFQEKNPHLPPMLTFMDIMIPLESPSRIKQELKKIAGVWVKDIMTTYPYTVKPETSLADIATMMVEKHITILPVLEEEQKLVGIVTKSDVLRAAFHIGEEE